MKKVIITLSTIFLLSCSGESIEVTNDQNLSIDENISTVENNGRRIEPNNAVPEDQITVTKDLIAGQHYTIGTVVVDVDQELNTMVVTYTIDDPNYTLLETHLYLGECGEQPINGQGNPQVGRFPYKEVHENETTFTYTINMVEDGIAPHGCVAAHASVISADGTISHTAWAAGVPYGIDSEGGPGNNWAMIFGYILN